MVTLNPLACSNLASEAAIIPLFSDDVILSVTKIYLTVEDIKIVCSLNYKGAKVWLSVSSSKREFALGKLKCSSKIKVQSSRLMGIEKHISRSLLSSVDSS